MFQFKQFTIQQDRTAMKVCTDACVLGAYVDVQGARILDIGTGTGLLALMAAQRNATALIDAVEIDELAADQATENVANSRFAERVRVIQGAIQTYQPAEVYDRILANPPFYTNHLPSPDAAVNRALHTGDLPFAELVDAVVRLLKKDGQWWVLLPPPEARQVDRLADGKGLKPFRRLLLRHHAGKPVFRVVTGYSYDVATTLIETLDIYEQQTQTYTDAFRTLLRPFYLNL
ncbi:MAG: methyltransferase [Bacteroidetes bacterium]|nr:methyltransferase [Fibrella sp.]